MPRRACVEGGSPPASRPGGRAACALPVPAVETREPPYHAARASSAAMAAAKTRPAGPAAPRVDVAAAVCWRRDTGGELSFCLVRTRDGERWTFPKGHREAGETLARAAAREAAEEAGVVGELDERRLRTYRYPSRGGQDEPVAAYLLRVTETRRPEETWRRQIWCEAAAARRRLADGRGPRHADELHRTLDAALRRIQPRSGLVRRLLRPLRSGQASRSGG